MDVWPFPPNEPSVVFVSCTSLVSAQGAMTKIKGLIIKSSYSSEMTVTYTQVLKEIVQIREAVKTKGIATRISEVFAPMDSLPAKLGVELELCRTILQTLHDLGDILSYEDLGVSLFDNTVILEPLFLIDFIRQVFNHKKTGQVLPHTDLKAMDSWVGLDASHDGFGRKQMKAMKQLLQAFHLVYSADEDGVISWNSDLIVPAFWQTKTPAAWKFLGDILRINATRSQEGETMRVHWEYHFESGLPPPLFDHLVAMVVSASPYCKFDAGPDWIMYTEEEIAACRIMVSRDPRSTHRTIDVEAVVSETATKQQVDKMWDHFRQLCGAFVEVLSWNPGLPVSSFAWMNGKQTKTKTSLKRLIWSNDRPSFVNSMPPVATRQWFQRLVRKVSKRDD